MSSNRSDRAIVVVVGGEQDIDEDAGDDETSREYLRILYLKKALIKLYLRILYLKV